jgi:outer membrane immunogenic protein
MKLVAATLLTLSALGASVAEADQAGTKPLQPAPLPSWTGFYAGVNAGALWSGSGAPAVIDWSRLTLPGNLANSATFGLIPQPNFASTSSAGFMAGGQVGYNWQISDRVVVGVETDFQGFAGAGSNRNSGWVGASTPHDPNSVGTARGRAGYLVTPNLQVYGTGGLAYGAGN